MIYESIPKDCALTVQNDPRGRGIVLIISPAPGRRCEPEGAAAILAPRDVVRLAVELLGSAGRDITLEVLEQLKKTPGGTPP